MRSFVVATVLISFLAFSQAGVIEETLKDESSPFSLIDPIIKAILEGMRPKLADLKVNDINKNVMSPGFNGTIIVTDILVKNLDSFIIQNLKSSVIPLRLTNLTLNWNDVVATASYDVDVSVSVSESSSPVHIFGKGKAQMTLSGIYFTIGANIELKGKVIQVKPKGFFGFDMSIDRANVTLSSLMGSSEFGKAVGVFLSKVIPDLVETMKNPFFEAFHDDIVNFVNEILRNGGNSFALDELPEVSLDDLDLNLDLSEGLDSFFRSHPLELNEIEFDSDLMKNK